MRENGLNHGLSFQIRHKIGSILLGAIWLLCAEFLLPVCGCTAMVPCDGILL